MRDATSPLTPERARRLVEGFEGRTVLVLGDVMLDRYLWGNVSRISPEAPVPIVEVESETVRLGGAANVAHNVMALGGRPLLAGVIGDDHAAGLLRDEMKARGLPEDGLIVDGSRPTSIKTRIVARHQQVVRADQESREELDPAISRRLAGFADRVLGNLGAVILSDYGKGVITGDLLADLLPRCRDARIPVCVDPKETHFFSYRGVSVVTPNVLEAGAAWGRAIRNIKDLDQAGRELRDRLDCDAFMITRGERGISLFEKDCPRLDLPTVAREVYDVTGAGDTVVSTYAVAIAAGATPAEAAGLANHAAGIVVREVGTATATGPEILKSVIESLVERRTGLELLTSVKKLDRIVAEARKAGLRVVFTNGCFDILHRGHKEYLEEARRLGDLLIVGLNDDASVARLKGPSRPINSLEDRAAVLKGLSSVDYVVEFKEDTPMDLIRRITPDVLVKGGDYRIEDIVGKEHVEASGGQVVVLKEVPGRSTTAILRRLAPGGADRS